MALKQSDVDAAVSAHYVGCLCGDDDDDDDDGGGGDDDDDVRLQILRVEIFPAGLSTPMSFVRCFEAAMQKVVSRDPVTYLQFLKEHGLSLKFPHFLSASFFVLSALHRD